MTGRCAVHGATPSVASCSACALRMCDACFRFVVASAPICVRCAHERSTRARRRIALGVFTALVSLGGAALLATRTSDLEWGLSLAVLTGLLGVLVGLLLALDGTKHARALPALQRREDVPNVVQRPAEHARKARARRTLAAFSPSISGRTTALAVLAAMAFCSVCFPALLRLPRWLELELVLGAWWALGTLGLFVLLYRGYRIADDHFFHAADVPNAGRVFKDFSGTDPGCDGCGGSCGDGCGDVLALLALALVAALLVLASLFMAWLLVELALPLVFLAFYWALLLALRRAARDRHDCPGHSLRSLRWALTWSSVYFAPIAALVWLVHRALPALR